MGLFGKRQKRVRERTLGSNAGQVILVLFLSVLGIRIIMGLSGNMVLGIIIFILLSLAALIALSWKPPIKEQEILDLVRATDDDTSDSLYPCNSFGWRHHRVLQIGNDNRIKVWDVHRGVALNFIDTKQANLIAIKGKMLGVLSVWRVIIRDEESMESYALTPSERVRSLLIPDFDGTATRKIMADREQKSRTIGGFSFDDL